MKRSMLIIGISAAVFIVIAYLVGGSSLVLEGFNISVRTATQSALMLLASFVVIGQIQVLLSKEMLDKWLQKFSGIKGIIISALAGGLFPGGPYIYYPFILSFKEKKLPFYIEEADNINSISRNIESLSAIATENSASSEEGAANIQNYTEQIRKMTENIHEFKNVSISFSQDLEKYIV